MAWNRETRSLALAQGQRYSIEEVTDQAEDPVMEIYVLNETGLVFTRRYGCDLVQPFAAENFQAIWLNQHIIIVLVQLEKIHSHIGSFRN